MRNPHPKYKVIERTLKDGRRQIIVLSTYGGKTVKGTANCSLDDEYNYDIGCKLAMARCNRKVAEKRFKNMSKNTIRMSRELTELQKKYDKMVKNCEIAHAEMEDAIATEANIGSIVS